MRDPPGFELRALCMDETERDVRVGQDLDRTSTGTSTKAGRGESGSVLTAVSFVSVAMATDRSMRRLLGTPLICTSMGKGGEEGRSNPVQTEPCRPCPEHTYGPRTHVMDVFCL